MIAAVPLSFALLFLPDRIRVSVVGFVAGVCASLAPILFAGLIFAWLVGQHSFGVFPFLVALLSLVRPIANDYGHYMRIKNSRKALLATTNGEVTARIAQASAPDVLIRLIALIGNLCGIAAGVLWFLLR